MTLNFSRLNSLKSRIFFFFIVLLLLVQLIAFWAIRLAIKDQEEQRLMSALDSAATIFQTHFSSSHLILNKFNQTSNKILAEYFNDDTRSFLEALENFRSRVDADLAMSIDNSGIIKTQIIKENSTDGKSRSIIGKQQGELFPYPTEWLSLSEDNKFYRINNEVFQYSISEVRVANIETLGWIGFGNRIDDLLATKFYHLTGFHIKFILTHEGNCLLLANSRKASAHELAESQDMSCSISAIGLENSPPLTLGSIGDDKIQVIMYGSREDILSSIQQRWTLMLILIGLTLLLSLGGAYLIAGLISRPVRELVAQVKYITKGNYGQSILLNDSTEFGQLAHEFNLMKKAVIDREAKILHNASHDRLTNLPNRTQLLHVLDLWLKQGSFDHALFLIKINHIRVINESLGYELGDQIIKLVGDRLGSIKGIDLLAHLRADEFVLLVKSISQSSVIRLIEQISQVLELPYYDDDIVLHLQPNIGVALSHKINSSPSNYIRMADSALQVARKQKQLFKLYDKSLDTDQAERLSLINDLHSAIAKNEFRLFYQPKLELSTGKVRHVEALIRWFHPDKGIVSPDKFIPIAENTGQIDLITLWVLEEAARQSAEWKKDNLHLCIAVNISAQNLKSEKIYNSVQFILEQYGLNAEDLELEVTESAVVENPESAITLLTKFKEFGIRLSIDDYGTGYSSLAQLKQLPVHELKIDMSFIQKLPDNEDDKTIVKSTIELAHNMGLSVVAEGVETLPALQWLDAHGCEFIQGYYISKPLPANEFTTWLKQSEYF